jgi:hypothetical protein
MLYAKIADLECLVSTHRNRSRWLKESRERWKKRAVDADWQKLKDTRDLRVENARLKKALEHERFLNSMSRMNAKRREMAA